MKYLLIIFLIYTLAKREKYSKPALTSFKELDTDNDNLLNKTEFLADFFELP